MALPYHVLEVAKPYLKGEVLSLGYPDIQATALQIHKLFGFMPEKYDKTSIDWHGSKEPYPDTEEFFSRLGVKLTVVDYVQERGSEIVADLNYPHDFGKFDLVIDPGTLEHCFNIGQGFMSAAGAVKPGGAILHISPMSMLNHGFYNMNLTLFHDFYFQNDWNVVDMAVVPFVKPQIQATNRFSMFTEYLARVVAIRKTDAPLKYPTQAKYLEKNAVRLQR